MAKKRYRTDSEFVAMIGRQIAAAGRRIAGADPEQLAELLALREAVEAAVMVAVIGQRSQGIHWKSIGEATGTTKEAAVMKWAKGVHEAEAVAAELEAAEAAEASGFNPLGRLDPADPLDQAFVRAWNRGSEAAYRDADA